MKYHFLGVTMNDDTFAIPVVTCSSFAMCENIEVKSRLNLDNCRFVIFSPNINQNNLLFDRASFT